MFAPTIAKSCSDCPPPPARNAIRIAKLISLIVTGLHTSRMSATGRNQPSFLPPPPLHAPPQRVTPFCVRTDKALPSGHFPVPLTPLQPHKLAVHRPVQPQTTNPHPLLTYMPPPQATSAGHTSDPHQLTRPPHHA